MILLPLGWIANLRIDSEFKEGCLRFARVILPISCQLGKRRRNNRLRIHLKVPPQMFAIVASSEPVRTQRNQSRKEPRCKLIGHRLHVVTGRNDRTLGPIECAQNVRSLLGPPPGAADSSAR